MRAAAILGPGDLSKYLERFRRAANAEWALGPPPTSGDADVILIFGGDGTIHRHLSQLVTLGLPVLVVPCGSGNDFARVLRLRSVRDSLEAWRQFAADRNNVHTIDLGVIRQLASVEKNLGEASAPLESAAQYFCCVAGAGIDTVIARHTDQLPKWIRSRGGYAACALREILCSAPWPMQLSFNDEPAAPAKPTILAAFANASAYGGGMKIAPRAQLNDGKLDVCVVRAMGRAKLFCLFPTVYFGRHLGFREVEYMQAETAHLETGFPLDVYADGEFVCQTPVEFSVARSALRVIVPDSRQPFR